MNIALYNLSTNTQVFRYLLIHNLLIKLILH